MQTIPDAVLAIIALRRPDLRPLVDELRLSPHTAADIEQRLASRAIRGTPLGETTTLPGLTPAMIRGLAACALSDPYGAERNQTRLAPDDARDGWVNLALAIHLSGGRERHYFERGAQSGEFAAERRNGELWLKRAEVEARAVAQRDGGSEG